MPDHPMPSKLPWVDEGRCKACRRCVARRVCRPKALVALDPGEAPFIDSNRCYGCLACVPACPYEAILV